MVLAQAVELEMVDSVALAVLLVELMEALVAHMVAVVVVAFGINLEVAQPSVQQAVLAQ
jgi:Mn2+/Fe2+ NRAMP family transporter